MRRSPVLAPGVALLAAALLLGPSVNAAPAKTSKVGPRAATVKVIRTIPKAPDAFTEGLEVHGGIIYESTGLFGQSEIRAVDLKTGKILRRVPLDPAQFGEGLTMGPAGRFVQLTWKNNVALIRNQKSLAQIGTLRYEGEGWGLCYNSGSRAFVQSDGSSTLTLRDPQTFKRISSIPVTIADEAPPTGINELECDGRSIIANVWLTNRILVIDLASGRVSRVIDASSIAPTVASSTDDILNGIARLGTGRYLLTGKRWPAYYEVSFVDAGPLRMAG